MYMKIHVYGEKVLKCKTLGILKCTSGVCIKVHALRYCIPTERSGTVYKKDKAEV